MKTRLLVLILLVTLLVGGTHLAGAQSNPAIVIFESSLTSISLADAEAGETTTTLSWHTVGMTADYQLALHEYVLNDWHLVLGPDSVPLEWEDGARVVTVNHSLSFAPPTFLLSIIDRRTNGVVDQRTLTIPYDTSAVAEPPAIDEFATEVESVDQAALRDANTDVVVPVTWSISNRAPTAHLVFQQIFDDENMPAYGVETARANPWVPSEGSGPVVPTDPQSDYVKIRLQVVDAVTGDVYDESVIEILVAGTGGPVPPANDIISFTATPDAIAAGDPVTLSWEVAGANQVTIEQSVPNVSTQVLLNAQSPTGTAKVYVPNYADYSVTYTLRTADGQASAQVTVNIECDATYFFGTGEGCPSGEARQVGAVFQQFEGGYMLWRQDTNEIYVHYQATGSLNRGMAQQFSPAQYANLPDPTFSQAPPLNRQAPTQGFAKVWAYAPDVRQTLGWATSGMIGYLATAQNISQTRSPLPPYRAYITLSDGMVVATGQTGWMTVQ